MRIYMAVGAMAIYLHVDDCGFFGKELDEVQALRAAYIAEGMRVGFTYTLEDAFTTERYIGYAPRRSPARWEPKAQKLCGLYRLLGHVLVDPWPSVDLVQTALGVYVWMGLLWRPSSVSARCRFPLRSRYARHELCPVEGRARRAPAHDGGVDVHVRGAGQAAIAGGAVAGCFGGKLKAIWRRWLKIWCLVRGGVTALLQERVLGGCKHDALWAGAGLAVHAQRVQGAIVGVGVPEHRGQD